MADEAEGVVFHTFDVEELAKKLEVEDSAYRDAPGPASDDTKPGAAEQRIITEFRDLLLRARDEIETKASDLDAQRAILDVGPELKKLSAIPGACRALIERAIAGRRDNLEHLADAHRAELVALNTFKARNSIERMAHYPESRIWAFGVLMVFVLVESLLNSYFFSLGNELGLLGGMFQAIVVSVVNVGFAFMNGDIAIRQLYHVKPWRKAIGGLFLSGYLAFAVGFNLLVAHFRAQLENDPFRAVIDAVLSWYVNPVGIANVDAWILFLIGIAVAILATIDGLVSDDHYPGFGSVDRHYLAAHRAFEQAKSEARNAVNQAIDDCQKQLDDEARDVRFKATNYHGLFNATRRYVKEYPNFADRVQGACNDLLGRYRNLTGRIRATKAPAYFKELHEYGELRQPPAVDLKDTSQRIEAMQKNIEDLAMIVDDESKKLRALNMEYTDKLTDYFSIIDVNEPRASKRLQTTEDNGKE